ncbi:MAG: restriction endonuclease subunit S [Acholeplasma sp.]|jgi:type I restriction enzyme S subunit|nr:restriction endonuclease subunit S [Acholeplasma sp.]
MTFRNIKLADLSEVITKGTTPTTMGYDFQSKGINFYKAQDLLSRYPSDTDTKISIECHDALKRSKIRKNDILVSIAGTIGRVSIWNSRSEANCNQAIAIIRCKPDVNALFSYYALTSGDVQDQIKKMTKTTAQPNLNLQELGSILIPQPSSIEQKALANFLSSLDDKIELNKKINKNLEKLAQTLYKRWFVDFEFPNEDGEPYKSSGGEMVESEFGSIPKAWTIKEQGEYFPVITGKKNANIATSDGKYKFFTCSQEVYLTDSYSFEGDAILVAGNGDFNVKFYSGKFEAYQRTYVLIPQNKKLSGILYFAIQHNLNDITSGSRGSVISFITKGHIENFKVVFPNTTELEELGIIFRNILISIAHNNEENDRLSKLRDELLPKLMNGEIEVPIEE